MRYKTNPRCVLLVLLSTFYSCVLLAQSPKVVTPYHLIYSTVDGLPSETCIYLKSDSRGLLWIGTDQGAATFNGSEFNRLAIGESSDVMIQRIAEDTNGAIWMVNRSQEVLKVENDRLRKVYDFNYLKNSFTFPGWQRIIAFDVLSDSEMLIGNRMGAIKLNNGIFEELSTSDHHLQTDESKGIVEQIGNDLLAIYDTRLQCIRSVEFHTSLFDRRIDLYKYPEAQERDGKLFYRMRNEQLLVTAGALVFIVDSDTTYRYRLASNTTNSIQYINDSTFVIGTESDGIYLFVNNRIVEQWFPDFNVISATMDFEGGLWFGTVEKGLIFIPNYNISLAKPPGFEGSSLLVSSNGDDVLSIDESFNVFLNNELIDHLQPEGKQIVEFTNNTFSDGDILLASVKFTDDKGFLLKWDWNSKILHKTPQQFPPIAIEKTSYGDTIYGMYNRVYLLRRGKREQEKTAYNLQSIVANPDVPDSYFIVAQNEISIASIDSETHKLQIDKKLAFKEAIDQLLQIGGHWLINQPSEGISFLNLNDGSFRVANDSISVQIKSQKHLTDHSLLLGTNHGAYLLEIHPDQSLQLTDLTNQIGFSPFQINDIAISDHFIWLSSKVGIIKIPRYMLEESKLTRPRISIRGGIVNDATPFSAGDDLSIKTDANITFNIQYLTYRQRKQRGYKFRILPIDSNWNNTVGTELSFFNLPANDYKLQLKTAQGDIVERSFQVESYIYNRSWFIVLVSIILVSLLASPFVYQRRLQNQSIKAESKQNQLRLMMLNAQLKPHFIFNALSSIQGYILKNEAKTSSEYLSKFSQHIRKALEQSRNPEVSLSSALDSLENYLELEKLRLRGKMTFQFEVDPNISPSSVKIPVQLLQPYVENSIIHGFTENTSNLHINVRAKMKSSKELVFEIEDNGKGFGHDDPHLSEGRLGTKINHERMELLNAISDKRFVITFRNRKDNDGAIVTIFMTYTNHE